MRDIDEVIDLDSGEELTECACCGGPGSQEHAPAYGDRDGWELLLKTGMHFPDCRWWLSRGR